MNKFESLWNVFVFYASISFLVCRPYVLWFIENVIHECYTLYDLYNFKFPLYTCRIEPRIITKTTCAILITTDDSTVDR